MKGRTGYAALDKLLCSFELSLRQGVASRRQYEYGMYFARQLNAHSAQLYQLAEDHGRASDWSHDRYAAELRHTNEVKLS